MRVFVRIYIRLIYELSAISIWLNEFFINKSISNPFDNIIKNIGFNRQFTTIFFSAVSLLKAGLSLNFLFLLILHVFLLMVSMKLYYNKSNIGWISI